MIPKNELMELIKLLSKKGQRYILFIIKK